MPRTSSGMRSDIVATKGASMTLYPSWAVHHSNRMIGKEFWFSASRAIAPPAIKPPRMIHGVRLPKRERVRSEKVPKITFARSATTEPTALIVPSIDSLPAALMFSRTAGKITEVKATQGIAQATALKVKPMLKRMSLIRFVLDRGVLVAMMSSFGDD